MIKNIATISAESNGTYADFKARCDAELKKQYDEIADRILDSVVDKLVERYDVTLTRREPEPPASQYPEPQPPAADATATTFTPETDA